MGFKRVLWLMVCAVLLGGACSKEKAPFDPDAGGVNEITPDVAAPSPDAIALTDQPFVAKTDTCA